LHLLHRYTRQTHFSPSCNIRPIFFFSVFPHCSRFYPDELPTSVAQTDTHSYRHRDSETEKERCWKMLHEVTSACVLSSLLHHRCIVMTVSGFCFCIFFIWPLGMVSSVSCIELVKLRSFSQMSNKYVEIDPGEQRTVVDLVAFSPSLRVLTAVPPRGMRCSAILRHKDMLLSCCLVFLTGNGFRKL